MTKTFMKTVHCTISTLSPVHIGCGEDYYPTNYVIDGGFLHHFGEEGLLEALTLNEKKQLAKLAEEQNDNGSIKLQQFIHSKKDGLKNYATHSVLVSEELAKFYRTRIGQTVQHEGGGKKVHNRLEIARHAFNPYNQTPYFAGSSIKGAIRTALLNSQNDKVSLQTRANQLKIIDERGKPFIVNENYDLPRKSNLNDKLQKHLLGYQAITDNPKKGIKGDPLRLFKVSDAHYQNSDGLHSAEIRFAVNRKNKPSKFEAKGLYQLLECLPAHRSRSLNCELNFLADEKLNYRWTLQEIAKACNDFFLPQLLNELAVLQQLKYANTAWLNDLEKLLSGELGEALKTQKAFLLRIGQHGGAESNTLEGVRHIKIMQGQGNKPKFLTKPTTIWLAGDNKDKQCDLLPFGWVLVEIGDTKLEQTAQFLKNQAAKDYPLSENLKAQTKQRAEFLQQHRIAKAQREKQEQAQQEQQRLQAEAELAKQQALASLSDEQRQIAELRQEYEKSTPQNQPISGTLNPKLTALINQAATWSSEDKQALFALGTEINKTLWNTNRKVKDRLNGLNN